VGDRTRWLLVKSGWLLLASALVSGVVAALVTWSCGPTNAFRAAAFSSGNYFDVQGIVPVRYAVFAAALGITAGTALRRLIPAIAVTLGVFIGVRLLVDDVIRPHFLPTVTTIVSATSTWEPPGRRSRTSRATATGRSRSSRPASTRPWPRGCWPSRSG